MIISQCPCDSPGMGITDIFVLAGVMVVLFWIARKVNKKENYTEGKIGMKKLGIVIVLVVGIGLVLWAKQKDKMPSLGDTPSSQPVANVSTSPTALVLPRLLDLGATKCIPCKMMKPILEELKKEFEGKMQVDFIDVWENPGAGEQHGIQSIPTQIFFDSSGKELYRHVGFFSKADILGKWKELGVPLAGSQKSPSAGG